MACALSVEVLEWREASGGGSGGGAMAEADLLSAMAIPASLPLSFAMCRDLGLKLLKD
jgi:hypothetical protein